MSERSSSSNLSHRSSTASATPDEQALARVVTRHLDETLAQLDSLTVARLRAARAEALAGRSKPRLFSWSWLRLASWASALAAVLAIALWWGVASQPEIDPLEDIELLASAEPLEFYEDLEFYHWLAIEDHAS